nr:Imm51 family immunity protein [Acinetobacter sp. Marseille-Q1618]
MLFETPPDFQSQIFQSRADEGVEGNGYDWASLASAYVDKQLPELVEVVKFDPEADMFCAYSDDAEALKKFILIFRQALDKPEFMIEIFSDAELD